MNRLLLFSKLHKERLLSLMVALLMLISGIVATGIYLDNREKSFKLVGFIDTQNWESKSDIKITNVENDIVIDTTESALSVTFNLTQPMVLNLNKFDTLALNITPGEEMAKLSIALKNPQANHQIIWDHHDADIGRWGVPLPAEEQPVLANLFLSKNLGFNTDELTAVTFTFTFTEAKARTIRLSQASLIDDPQQLNLNDSYVNNTKLPVYELKISSKDKALMDDDLPDSGWSWTDAELTDIKNRHLYQVDARYRGDNNNHYYYWKKSWRFKFQSDDLLDGQYRSLNFIHPKQHLIGDWLPYLYAQERGIAAPAAWPARLVINDIDYGTFMVVEQIDEDFIERQGIKDASVYFGDPSRGNILDFGEEKVLLYDSKRMWSEQLKSDNLEVMRYDPLERLLSLVRESDADFIHNIESVIDVDNYLAWYATYYLFDSNHNSAVHNSRVYFDTVTGQFTHIPWDVMPGNAIAMQLEPHFANTLLTKRVFEQPKYLHQLNKLYWHEVNTFFDEKTFKQLAQKIYDLIDAEIGNDKFANNQDYSQRWRNVIDEKYTLGRVRWLKTQLMFARAWHNWFPSSGEMDGQTAQWELRLLIDGYSGVNELQLNTGSFENVALYADVNDNSRLDAADQQLETIKNFNGRNWVQTIDNSVIFMPGKKDIFVPQYELTGGVRAVQLEPSPATISVLVASTEKMTQQPTVVEVRNATTGEILAVPATSSAAVRNVSSIKHIVGLPQKELVWSGTMTLTKDTFIPPDTDLIIQPGTTILIDPKINIWVWGGLQVRGTKDQPISIQRSQPGFWGTIAIIGSSQANSFSHCSIEGGSGGFFEGTVVTGQVAVHDGEVTIDTCSFMNSNGDDGFNAKRAKVAITNSIFSNNSRDGLDVDQSNGTISNSHFGSNGNDGIDVGERTTSLVISESSITGSGDKGVSVGEESSIEIKGSEIRGNVLGVASKDRSRVTIENSLIVENHVGLALYEKKNDSGPGSVIITGTTVTGNNTNLETEGPSRVWNLDIFWQRWLYRWQPGMA